ncbi:MAG: EAL domain-containing protein [Acidimicrobiales bacterium]
MGDGFFVAVNASPAELESPEFVDHVRDALVETALPADALFVELSERFAIPDTAPAAHPAFQGLHDLGVRLLLDDFGEGRTSLAYLRGLPISGLKLDRLLVDNAVKSDADRIILESITQLAHALSLVVIAEGIEADAHLGAAHAAGCDYLQGYHISRPCSADVVTELLERGLPRRTSDRRGSALPSSVADPLGVSS